jgi:type III pantothenate kinase
MKVAAIDFGNTRIKLGIFENNILQEVKRFDSIATLKVNLLDFDIQQAIISSVSNPIEEIQKELSFINTLIFLTKSTQLPILNSYKSPDTLGLDRIAAAIGAHFNYQNENCLIIDIGTAIKYDLILANGEFIGGIISPGRQMRFKALHNFTKKLPLLDSVDIPELIGIDTNSCMISGVMNGIVAEINGIIDEYLKIHKIKVLICGGDAPYFETSIKYPTFAHPNLVLEGLNRIFQHNVK